MSAIMTITSRAQLRRFQAEHDLREDWHEPDESDVSVAVANGTFDNAGNEPLADWAIVQIGDRARGQTVDQVVARDSQDWGEAAAFLLVGGEIVACVNLATLFALAAGTEEVGA